MSDRVIAAARFQEGIGFRELLGELPTGWNAGKRSGRQGGKAELEKLREQAYEEGHAAGFKKGFDEGRAMGHKAGAEQGRKEVLEAEEQALAEFRDELGACAESVFAAIESWYEKAEHELAALAIEIAARVVGAELESNPDVALSMTREALAEIGAAREARIRLSPFDAAILRKNKDRLLALAPTLRNVEIVDDESIEHGCVIESDGGTVRNVIREKLAILAQSVQRAA